MNALFLFLLKAALINALMLGFYHFAIRPGRNFRLMRTVLLLSIVLPLVLPLLPMAIPHNENSEVPVYVFSLPAVSNEVIITPEQNSNLIPLIQNTVYFSLACILLMGTMLSILSVIRKYSLSQKRETPYGKVLIDNSSKSPYSFFKWVFFSDESLLHPAANWLLRHEFSHVKHLHSFDRLLSAIFRAFFWFSPFAHFNHKLITEVHEYQADADAITSFDNTTAYNELIVSYAGISGQHQISNPFSAHLKKRIVMINNLKPGKLHLLRIAAGVSVIVAFALLSSMVRPAVDMNDFSITKINQTQDTDIQSLPPVVISQNQLIPQETIYQDDTISPAEYPGGEEAMMKFYQSNIRYPLEARNQNIQGTVEYKVFIEADGSVTSPSIVSGIGGGCDEEVLKVATMMPKWKPAMKDGKPVRTSVVLPVKFTLSNEGSMDENEEIFNVVDKTPEFPGGDAARMAYLQQAITYPEEAQKNKTEGTVYVTFIVEKDGAISQPTVLRGIGSGCDIEAMKAVNGMPRWKPGIKDGKPVRTRFNMPFKFTLNEKANAGSDEVFTVVENHPKYPGGDEARAAYMQKAVAYPEKARKEKIEGTVYVSFIVEKNGTISNVKVLRGIGGGCDEVAVSAIQNMPAWEPGTQRGKAVRVQFNMPVKFSLSNDNKWTSGLENLPESQMYGGREVFNKVDVPPVFPGGNEALLNYLRNKTGKPGLTFANPEKDKLSDIFLSLIVEPDGSVTAGATGVEAGKKGNIYYEAMKQMPAWKPGSKAGKAVPVKINLFLNEK